MMKGKPEVIELLNNLLSVLYPTTANSYTTLSLLQKWGYKENAIIFDEIFREQLKSSEKTIKRIVFLDAIPKIVFDTPFFPENIEDVLIAARDVEMMIISMCTDGIETSVRNRDYGTRTLLENILNKADQALAAVEAQISQSMR